VGSALFGHNHHIRLFSDTSCQSASSMGYDLTNQPLCYNSGFVAQSFMVTSDTSQTTPGGNCEPLQASNPDDDTVTLKLSSGNCCSSFETITIGKLDVCHKPKDNHTITGFSQRVGPNLFGRQIHIQMYTDDNCGSTNFGVAQLSNNPTCIFGDTWNSFKIASSSDPGSPPPAPSCGLRPATNNDNTVTLSLFSDTGCCTPLVKSISIGTLNECHDAGAPFNAITEAVGQNMFGRKLHVYLYPDSGCSTSTYGIAELSNSVGCVFNQGPAWQSFMIAPA
jgi:hypothetical protein